MSNPITIFISYAHKDAAFLQELKTFLKPYERNEIITIWTDKNIIAGQEWDNLIKQKLQQSAVILFLVSPDFLASDYINDKEIKEALIKEAAYNVPIIIRPTDLSMFEMKYLQIIPTGAKPVADWDNRDKAWNDVVENLKNVFIRVEPELSTVLQNTPGATSRTSLPSIRKQQDFIEPVMKIGLILLLLICIAALVYGFIHRDAFYVFAALAGVGAAFAAYVFLRRKNA